MEFARVERGEVVVQPTDFDLAPLLRDVLAEFHGRPGGGRLLGEVPPHLPVHADPARVTQVVANLVENALKYAPEGPIVLRAQPPAGARQAAGVAPEAQPVSLIRVEVADSGPGIPKREQPRVWEKFYRGQRVVAHHLAGGTGIGLAVVKALVEAQGGRVGLDSIPGRGATFWFELPAAPSSDSPPARSGPPEQIPPDQLAGGDAAPR